MAHKPDTPPSTEGVALPPHLMRTWKVIYDYHEDRGVYPTLREIQAALTRQDDAMTHQGVAWRRDQLAAAGVITLIFKGRNRVISGVIPFPPPKVGKTGRRK